MPLRSKSSAFRSIIRYPFPLRICGSTPDTKNSSFLKHYDDCFSTDWKQTSSDPAAFLSNGPRSLRRPAPRSCAPDYAHECWPRTSLGSTSQSGPLRMKPPHKIPPAGRPAPPLRALRTNHRHYRTLIRSSPSPPPLRDPLEKDQRNRRERASENAKGSEFCERREEEGESERRDFFLE